MWVVLPLPKYGGRTRKKDKRRTLELQPDKETGKKGDKIMKIRLSEC